MDTPVGFKWAEWVLVPMISALLGIVATLIVQRVSKKRKVLGWALGQELAIIEADNAGNAASTFDVPIKLNIGSVELDRVHVIAFRLANTGNVVIEGLDPAILVPEASCLAAKVVGDLGEFAKHVSLHKGRDRVDVHVDHLNPGAAFEVQLLVSDYRIGSGRVDAAAPGLTVKRQGVPSLSADAARATRLSASLSLGILGGLVEGLLHAGGSPSRQDSSELSTAVRQLAETVDQRLYHIEMRIQSAARRLQK
ncbi:MAG: hypothetical protein IT431_02350 [Phycisphaerales bacterium]|nr:hypothetical protein [Phycisphaerales bacterium]